MNTLSQALDALDTVVATPYVRATLVWIYNCGLANRWRWVYQDSMQANQGGVMFSGVVENDEQLEASAWVTYFIILMARG